MKLPIELSERISLLRFPLIAGVVFLHTYDTAIGRSDQLQYEGWVSFIFNYISRGLASISVPLLFLVAGYLFFYSFEASISGFAEQIRKRVRTLVVPLLFWNLACLALFAIIQAGPAAQYFSGRSRPIAEFTPIEYLNALIGVTSHPIAYQFWFVRDLVVLAILAPVIYLFLTWIPIPFLFLLGVRWFPSWTTWTIPFPSREAAFFFCVGSALALRNIDLRVIDKWWLVTLAYLPLSVIDALTKDAPMNNSIHKTAELLGVAFVLWASKHLAQVSAVKDILLKLSTASFFLFATHEPLLTAVRKLSYVCWRPTDATAIVFLYFASPLIVIAFCVGLYFTLVRVVPVFTGVITGGRLGISTHAPLLKATS